MNPGRLTLQRTPSAITFTISAEGLHQRDRAVFIALETEFLTGCAVVPYQRNEEGSTVFLPFRANQIYALKIGPNGAVYLWRRAWQGTRWSEHLGADGHFRVEVLSHVVRVHVSVQDLRRWTSAESGEALPRFAIWAKDLTQQDGWGLTLPLPGTSGQALAGDVALRAVGPVEPVLTNGAPVAIQWSASPRPRIYQLLPRLFSNTNETRKPNGTLAENGVGKFADLTAAALRTLRDDFSLTHVWLTGVLAQATSTDYSSIGHPPDDPDLLKGLAGSPYAIRDYGDVCADYAVVPEERMVEFQALLHRAHEAGLRVIIDFVPNHVARSHRSDLISFGHHDDPGKFFDPHHNFFWLQADSPGGGAPLKLPTVRDGQFISPTCAVLRQGTGHYRPETTTGRVTGNNACTWSPSQNDWYETVKLNYGYDFTTGRRFFPHDGATDLAVPDTWYKMDAVLKYWQSLGVDGFRCDMSHMVPPEFWSWSISRARERNPEVYFVAEAYNNDPMKVEGGYELTSHFQNVMIELLNAGFNAVYDDPAYKALKHVYDGPGWANDLDAALASQGPYVFPQSLRYAENHDEVRLAGKNQWGQIGMEVGRPVSGILYGLSRGPILLYSGQEVGEPADGEEGFGGDDARTTIFDYWSMPEVAKWVNGLRYDGGRLSAEQKELRAFYGRLLRTCGEPAFQNGDFFPLNRANEHNDAYGRLGEGASGHWLYAFLRADPGSDSCYLVVANLHRSEAMHQVRIGLSEEGKAALRGQAMRWVLIDEVGGLPPMQVSADELLSVGILIPKLPPLSVSYFAYVDES